MITKDREACLKELRRELDVRKRVYPKWIQQRKLHRDVANTQFLSLATLEFLLSNMTSKDFDRLCSAGRQGCHRGPGHPAGRPPLPHPVRGSNPLPRELSRYSTQSVHPWSGTFPCRPTLSMP